jgi:NADPH-dependent curcumin reductase CurA
LAAQIAKLCGNRVVASAGSEDKVAWLRDDLGLEAFNHRDGDLDSQLRAIAPDGIDVYFDSVGGGHLEAALDHLNRRGRVAMCGSVSDYESEPRGPRNLFLTVSKDLTLRGFRGSSNLHLWHEMQHRLTDWLRNGQLVHRETVFAGLDAAPHALAAMIAGRTIGKTLVSIG